MKKLSVVMLTLMMCLSAVPTTGVIAEETSVLTPDWIPTNFDEALEFHNTYGITHIEDGLICLVFKETTSSIYSYDVMPTTDTAVEIIHNTCEDTEGVHGEYYDTYSDSKYEVVVYKPFANGTFEVTLNRTYKEITQIDSSYQFYIDENGITETDVYQWLPDCITEYNDFLKQNGTASVQNNYIVYCAEVGSSTGAALFMEQNGTAEVEKILTSFCSESKKIGYGYGGGTSYFIEVYQPISDGNITISWKVGRNWDSSEGFLKSDITRKYEISENGSVITEMTNEDLTGDINGDGIFGVSDVITFQKWLLSVPDTKLVNWKMADFDGNGILNIFDLCVMKRELIRS